MNEEPCRVSELLRMTFDESIRPRAFFDRAIEIAVEDWADLDQMVVSWLVREGHLRKAHLPIKNYARRKKYFIDAMPHPYGDWHKVGDFYVDTKYNAQSHINNLLSTLEHIALKDPHFYLAFRRTSQ